MSTLYGTKNRRLGLRVILRWGVKMVTSPREPTSPTVSSTSWFRWFSGSKTEPVATFLIHFGAHLSIRSLEKVNVLVLVEWSYNSLPPPSDVDLVSLEWLLYQGSSPISPSNTCLCGIRSCSHTSPHTSQA